MKAKLIILLFLICGFSYPQSKTVNSDSLQWEKENPNWEKEIFYDPDFVNKLEVSKSDKRIWLQMSMKKECRIFGYQAPNKKSKRLILFSIWTFDVENNPCNCQFGSYYETTSMNMKLKYLETKNSFIKAALIKDEKQIAIVYFEKKWVEFVN